MCEDGSGPTMAGHAERELTAASAAELAGPTVTRRDVLRGMGAGTLSLAALATSGLALGSLTLGVGVANAVAPAPDPRLLTRAPKILPRSTWAGSSCPVRGPLPVERAGDVTYLLVHHTDVPGNVYTAPEVASMLRGMYRFHTGPDKRWPDLAYNFIVDKYGRIWEGRAGSATKPVIPSATGGSQGFDQLACFLGNHTTSPPTGQAQASMISLLAWMGRKYAVDLRPGAMTSFISRGSNRWPKGAKVTTRTLEGHRSMSLSQCPGNAAYPLVRDVFPAAAYRLSLPPVRKFGMPLGR